VSEREPTAEELAFMAQFNEQVAGRPVTDEQMVEVTRHDEEVAAPTDLEADTSPSTEDDDGSQFLRRLFERKPGEEAFIRSLHADGAS
jgi:hypothetical protein